MNIWEKFEKEKTALFDFVNGKQVILWGYDYNGMFIQHMFETANKHIEIIVDDGSIHPKLAITRSCELGNINPRQYAVIISGNNNETIEDFLETRGFVKGRNYLYALELFGIQTGRGCQLSYFGYLESVYGVDISARKGPEDMEKPNDDCLMYSPGIGYGLVNVVNELSIHENDALFDIGSGKGGALLLFNKLGFDKIGGVEYDKQLYSVAVENFKKLGVDSTGLVNGDATLMEKELDGYNYFFMYNPFLGETFTKVIHNIEKSWERKPRKIILIYSGPYCHDEVIKNDRFCLTKKIYTDYSVRNVYIYTIEE